jgi:hypothetical protein
LHDLLEAFPAGVRLALNVLEDRVARHHGVVHKGHLVDTVEERWIVAQVDDDLLQLVDVGLDGRRRAEYEGFYVARAQEIVQLLVQQERRLEPSIGAWVHAQIQHFLVTDA